MSLWKMIICQYMVRCVYSIYSDITVSLQQQRHEANLLAVVEGRRGEAAEDKQGLVLVLQLQSRVLGDALHTLLRLQLQYGLNTEHSIVKKGSTLTTRRVRCVSTQMYDNYHQSTKWTVLYCTTWPWLTHPPINQTSVWTLSLIWYHL